MSDPITINIDALTEDEAFRVFSKMRTKFGWAGTIFTRGDVEGMLEQYDPIHDGETINTEQGWDIIQGILDDWLKEKGLLA